MNQFTPSRYVKYTCTTCRLPFEQAALSVDPLTYNFATLIVEITYFEFDNYHGKWPKTLCEWWKLPWPCGYDFINSGIGNRTSRPTLCYVNKALMMYMCGVFNVLIITVTSEWARWRLKSPASRLFTQPFIQAQIKENINAPRHWPLCGKFAGGRWIPRTNGQ